MATMNTKTWPRASLQAGSHLTELYSIELVDNLTVVEHSTILQKRVLTWCIFASEKNTHV